jgi:hypothetical protein
MFIEEFVNRAEAIRTQRPSPILEEVEGLGQRGGNPDPAGAAIGLKKGPSWKHLFKPRF